MYFVDFQKHVDSCLGLCQSEIWVEDEWSKDRISIAHTFGQTHEFNDHWTQAKDILERGLKYGERTLNEELVESLLCTECLAQV